MDVHKEDIAGQAFARLHPRTDAENAARRAATEAAMQVYENGLADLAEELGFGRPACPGDWRHIAAIVGVPDDGSATPDAIIDAAAAWVEREALRAKVASKATARERSTQQQPGRRGRPKKQYTQQRADHAQKHVATNGLGWPEAFAGYQAAHPGDTEANVNTYRQAYEREYAAK